MTKLIAIFSLWILTLGLSVGTVRADGGNVSYTVDSSFSSSTPTTPYSAPGDLFSFTFNEPATCTCGPFSGGFATNVFVNYTFGSTTFTNIPATVQFAPSSLFGLFDIEVTVGGVMYDWYLTGAQLYTLNPAGTVATLIPSGTFAINPGSVSTGLGSFFYDTNGDFGALPGGSVIVKSANVPEPSALLMLICGCLALVLFHRKYGELIIRRP